MGLGVYGPIEKHALGKLSQIAFDISINKSPFYVTGKTHQGIDLNERLTK